MENDVKRRNSMEKTLTGKEVKPDFNDVGACRILSGNLDRFVTNHISQ